MIYLKKLNFKDREIGMFQDNVEAAFKLVGQNDTSDGTKVDVEQAFPFRILVTDVDSNVELNDAITADRALISDSDGLPTESSVTATELGYVAGVTSPIQAQLDSKITPSVQSVNLPSDQTVSSVYPTFADITGLVVSFTTAINNQIVMIVLQASCLSTGGADVAFIAYKLDASSTFPLLSSGFGASNYANLCVTFPLVISTAGAHSVQIRGAKAGTNYTVGSVSGSSEMPAAVSAVLL